MGLLLHPRDQWFKGIKLLVSIKNLKNMLLEHTGAKSGKPVATPGRPGYTLHESVAQDIHVRSILFPNVSLNQRLLVSGVQISCLGRVLQSGMAVSESLRNGVVWKTRTSCYKDTY